MAKRPKTKESAEYDNFLEESNKPLEKTDLTGFVSEVEKAEEDPDKWEKHWMDMPEFIQEEAGPFKKVIVSFRNEEDYNEFAELLKQKLTPKTKSIWYPALAKDANCLKRWFGNDE